MKGFGGCKFKIPFELDWLFAMFAHFWFSSQYL